MRQLQQGKRPRPGEPSVAGRRAKSFASVSPGPGRPGDLVYLSNECMQRPNPIPVAFLVASWTRVRTDRNETYVVVSDNPNTRSS